MVFVRPMPVLGRCSRTAWAELELRNVIHPTMFVRLIQKTGPVAAAAAADFLGICNVVNNMPCWKE